MRHTPGPWTVLDDKRTGISVRSEDSEYSVCSLSIAAVHERSPSVARANARLIAAAPDLLATLEALFEHCAMVHKVWGDGDNSIAANAAREAGLAAIKKATQP